MTALLKVTVKVTEVYDYVIEVPDRIKSEEALFSREVDDIARCEFESQRTDKCDWELVGAEAVET